MVDDVASAPDAAQGLNVLFVGGFDSSNYAYVELVRELAARGHACTVVVENEHDSINNKMFIGAGIPMVPLSRYPLSALASVDFVVSGPFVRKQAERLFAAIYERGVFLISFASLFSSVTMWASPDLIVATSEAKFEEFARSGLRYSMVALGNPQYDPLVRARNARPPIDPAAVRKVLVVDQGAYPLGDAGKTQLARTLVNIAKNNPGMTFDVKPRYLPDEAGDHLHAISDHLYTYLTDTPDNLVLIRESTILEELVLEYDAMITLWSTAHLDAAVLDLPLLLIGGFDSADVFDVRKQRVDAAYAHLRDTGCLVDWRELENAPVTFHHVSPGYTREEFFDISAPCAPKIVDLMEKVGGAVVRRGRGFAETFQLTYPEFMDRVAGLKTIAARSEEARLNRLLRRNLNAVLQALAFDHRVMGGAFDMSGILELWDRRVGPEATERDVQALVEQAREAGKRLKEEYFASHPDEVAGDVFVQDYYFDWLLATKRYRDLLAYDGPVVARASLEFDRGMASSKLGHKLRAVWYLVDSFDVSLREPIRVLKKDKAIRTLLYQADQSMRTHAVLFLMDLYGKHEALGALDIPPKPGLDALVYYKMKALAALGRPRDAKALYEEYSVAVTGLPEASHRAGIKHLALRSVIGWYRWLARGYAARLG
jgi:hypothetical protein